MRGWPSEYLRAMIFFSFCCLFAAEVAAGIVGLAGWRGDTVVVVVNCQTCPNREGSDRQPQQIIIILVTTSSNKSFFFLESDSPPLSFPRAGLLFPWPRCRSPLFSIYSSSWLWLAPNGSLPSTNQTSTRSPSPMAGQPSPTHPPSVAPSRSHLSLKLG